MLVQFSKKRTNFWSNNSRWCLGNCRHRNGRWCRHVLHRHLINRPAFIIQLFFHDDEIVDKLTPHIRFDILIDAINKPDVLPQIKQELENNKVENISIKILDVSDTKIVLYVDGVINNKIDENQIIMTLRKYPDIRKSVTHAVAYNIYF